MTSSNDTATRKTILSGSTTTGNLTLGNYIGAVSNWKAMQVVVGQVRLKILLTR
ncbi:hypothetical protein N8946_05710 [Pseudomonadales bacterium]|nr:hypothetical protein [Pseudomonadales bacterium]